MAMQMCPSCDRPAPPTATVGDACAACGAQLVAGDASDPLDGTVFGAPLDKLDLVDIDQRGGASPAPAPRITPAAPAAPTVEVAFAPPARAPADAPLELDGAWQAERSTRSGSATSPAARRFMRENPPAPAPHRRGLLVALVVLACAIGAGAYYYVTSQDTVGR